MSASKALDQFGVSVICPLEVEALAMIRQLDNDKDYGEEFSTDCHFTLGGIGKHNIVITSLPAGRQGHTSAAVAAQQTKAKFPNIQCILLVGIAGGVPSEKHDIRLGDVVVSFPDGRYGGVVQYDFGKEEEQFMHSGHMNSVPQRLLTFLTSVKLRHARFAPRKPKFVEYLELQMANGLEKPNSSSDRLFPSIEPHKDNADCKSCDETKALVRDAREHPQVHYGLIASGNRVMKNGAQRDHYNQMHGNSVLAYEMEAAGLMNFTPCLVIRGVSDYADSHKPPDDKWHPFAAAAAASFAREFIEQVTVETVISLSSQEVPTKKVHWYVPFSRNKRFTGRGAELHDIIEKLNLGDDGCQRVAIAGLGGVGKTQIALEAAFQIHESSPDRSIFWIPAIDVASVDRAFREIAQLLQIPGIDTGKADIKSLVKKHLSTEEAGKWLIIVDNADDIEMLFDRSQDNLGEPNQPALVDYFPSSQKSSILFTTRNWKVAVKHAQENVVELREMSEIDSFKLLEMSLINKSLMQDYKSATKLLHVLSNLPLAIKQTASFINENTISLSSYLDIYESSDKEFIELLSRDFEDFGRYRESKNPVALTWFMSFQQIQRSSELAATYLYVMSCVAPQDIPHSILPGAASKLEEIEVMGILKAYSFIVERRDRQSYDMHRLVQLAVRNWLSIRNELNLWISKTLWLVQKVYPKFDYKIIDQCALLLPHTQYVLSYSGPFEGCQHPFIELSTDVSVYYINTGKDKLAQPILQREIEICNQVLGPDHPKTLRAIANLSWALQNRGHYTTAEALERNALHIKERVLGPEHPDTIKSLNNLATALHYLERYLEAEMIHRRAFEIRSRTLGAEHRDTLVSMDNIAVVLKDQGRFDKSEPLQRKTLQIREKVLGPNHPDTMYSLCNLGVLLHCQGKLKESEMFQRRAFEGRIKLLGAEHPATIASMGDLAYVLHDQGRFEESEILQRKLISLSETVLGLDHPDTISRKKYLERMNLEVKTEGDKVKMEGDKVKMEGDEVKMEEDEVKLEEYEVNMERDKVKIERDLDEGVGGDTQKQLRRSPSQSAPRKRLKPTS